MSLLRHGGRCQSRFMPYLQVRIPEKQPYHPNSGYLAGDFICIDVYLLNQIGNINK